MSFAFLTNNVCYSKLPRKELIKSAGQVFFHRRDATGADGGMLRIRADIGFPMPAALAFLAVGLGYGYAHFGVGIRFDFKLRDV